MHSRLTWYRLWSGHGLMQSATLCQDRRFKGSHYRPKSLWDLPYCQIYSMWQTPVAVTSLPPKRSSHLWWWRERCQSYPTSSCNMVCPGATAHLKWLCCESCYHCPRRYRGRGWAGGSTWDTMVENRAAFGTWFHPSLSKWTSSVHKPQSSLIWMNIGSSWPSYASVTHRDWPTIRVSVWRLDRSGRSFPFVDWCCSLWRLADCYSDSFRFRNLNWWWRDNR